MVDKYVLVQSKFSFLTVDIMPRLPGLKHSQNCDNVDFELKSTPQFQLLTKVVQPNYLIGSCSFVVKTMCKIWHCETKPVFMSQILSV
jgi:hypothetical protein